MEKQDEVDSQWASQVIGCSSVYPTAETYGTQLTLGAINNGKHGPMGWCSHGQQNEWIELAFEKEVLPMSIELYLYPGYHYPQKIFGRGPANELIEVYNSPQTILCRAQNVGFKVDLINVQKPMKQFRFEYVVSPNSWASMMAVRVFKRPSELDLLRNENKQLSDENKQLKAVVAQHQSSIAALNETVKELQEKQNKADEGNILKFDDDIQHPKAIDTSDIVTNFKTKVDDIAKMLFHNKIPAAQTLYNDSVAARKAKGDVLHAQLVTVDTKADQVIARVNTEREAIKTALNSSCEIEIKQLDEHVAISKSLFDEVEREAEAFKQRIVLQPFQELSANDVSIICEYSGVAADAVSVRDRKVDGRTFSRCRNILQIQANFRIQEYGECFRLLMLKDRIVVDKQFPDEKRDRSVRGTTVDTWNVDQVAECLRKIGLEDLIEMFKKHKIDGEVLMKIDLQYLADLLLLDLNVSEKFLEAAEKLRQETVLIPLPKDPVKAAEEE